MATVTKSAETHEPHGDPEHVAYGRDFSWECTCGSRSSFLTTRDKAEYSAEQHEKYCPDNGDVTVDVVR